VIYILVNKRRSALLSRIAKLRYKNISIKRTREENCALNG